MKNTIFNFVQKISLMDQQRVRLMWLILALLLFVLGAGAPEAGGGVGINGGAGGS
jgi:hypothetical protein